MNILRLLPALALYSVFSPGLLQADTTINVAASSLSNGQPGENGPGFSFITKSDDEVTVKAMFTTHWLTNRNNLISYPKSTSFTIDDKWYPSSGGPEDFYGYVDGRIWPERVVQKDQQIWIQETIFLNSGPHTIQFRNGLMERDESGSRIIYSYASWATASITVTETGRAIIIEVLATPADARTSIAPATQILAAGISATFALTTSGASKAIFSGTDGSAILNPSSNITLRPPPGDYTFTYTAQGTANVVWTVHNADQIWIYPPNGAAVNVTSVLNYTAVLNGDYTLRAIAGGVTTAKSFRVDLPTALSTATLTVTADSSPTSGPQVTEFSPVAASFTAQSGAAAGHTYGRSWQGDGGWTAYLGRDGVGLRVVGQSSDNPLASFEIQAKSPSGDWFLLTSGSPGGDAPNGPGMAITQMFKVRLGEINPAKPLLPADPSLIGKWLLRARVSDASGAWSAWAFEQPLNVVYPLIDVSVVGKTLPPIEDKDWFTESAEKTYTYQVLVP